MFASCPACHNPVPEGASRCASCDTPLPVSATGETTRAEQETQLMPTESFPSQHWSQPGATGPVRPLAPGVLLGGRYEILEHLGQGGMGAVYKARDREVSRLVALKVIRPDLADNRDMLERFKKELILARQITHPNIVRIYDLGLADGHRFITMEFVEGRDLGRLLAERGKFPPSEAAQILLQVSRALEAAHAQGIIHRDLKPQNIMLASGGRLTVMDFGIAHAEEPDAAGECHTLTQPGTLLGTPRYMSPEQARGEHADSRSDIFSAGIICYELLTGKPLHEASTTQAILARRITETAPPTSRVEPNVPRRLSRIVARCLEIDRARRYQSAAQLTRDLETFLSMGARRSRPWIWAAAAVVAIASAAALISPRLQTRTPVPPPASPPPVQAPVPVAKSEPSLPAPAREPSRAEIRPIAPQPDAAAELQNARGLLSRGDLHAAELAYRALQKHTDTLPDAQRRQARGEYYLLLQDPRAIAEFEALDRLRPDNPAIIGSLAQAYANSGDFSRALAAAQRGLQADPRNPDLRHQLALYALYAGDAERSTKEARALVQSNPSFELGHVALVLAHMARNQPMIVENALQGLEALGPRGKSLAAEFRADRMMFAGRFDQASQFLEPALATDLAAHNGRSAGKMIMLAQVEAARHNPVKASAWADRAADSSSSAAVLEPAAEVYLDLGAAPKALALAVKLAAQPSPAARAYAEIIRGIAKLQDADPPAAIAHFESAKQLASTWLADYWLGRAYLEAHELDKADSLFAQCQQSRAQLADLFHVEQPTDRYFPPVIYYTARTRQAMRHPLIALKAYERFLTIKRESQPDPLVEDAQRRQQALSKSK